MTAARSKPLPWLRLYIEMVDDEKLRLLAFEDRWHYIAVLCCKGAGLLDAGDPRPLMLRKLGVKLGLAQRELEAAGMRLAEVGLIDAETWQPLGWDGRQFTSDADSTAADRKRRQREREKSEVTDASRVTVTDVTRTDTDTDLHQEKDQEPIAPSPAGSPRPKLAPKTPAEYPDGHLILLPCTGGAEWQLSREDMREMLDLYPGVDLFAELRKARGWLLGNPTKRKTERGMLRFLHNWLSRAQDRGGSTNGANQATSAGGMSVGDRIRATAQANDQAAGAGFDERWFGRTIEH